MKYYLKSHYQCGETIKLNQEDYYFLTYAESRAAELSTNSMIYGNIMVIDSKTNAVVAEYANGKKLEQCKQQETIASDLHRVASLHPRNNPATLQDTIRMIVDKCTECAKGGHFNTTIALGLMSIEPVEQELKGRGFKIARTTYGDGYILGITW